MKTILAGDRMGGVLFDIQKERISDRWSYQLRKV